MTRRDGDVTEARRTSRSGVRGGAAATALSLALVSALGAGCHESSEGAQPAASASAAAAASDTPPAASASASADPTAANAPDQTGSAGDDYDDTDPSALTDFHQVLDKHGGWSEDPKYGTVWVPAPAVVGADFVPYRTGGHWVYGDDYTWVSDYDWGWAPFHYGRWVALEPGGWGWIPGRVYSPAWVSWRVGAPGFGFVGWAPMAPTWGWRAGVVVSYAFPVVTRYSYCVTGDLFSRTVATRVVTGPRVAQAEAGTKVWAAEEERTATRHGHAPGPAPGKIGISGEAVAHAPPNDPGLARAQAFSKPATAVKEGAHPPSKVSAKDLPKVDPGSLKGKESPANTKTAPNVKTQPEPPNKGGGKGGKKEK